MADKYTGKADDRRYAAEDIDITYSLKRCIHAQYCVSRLSEVFDVDARPWIKPDAASADRIAETIHLCPSGALHYDRKDNAADEPTPSVNRIIVQDDGYLQFQGDLEIFGAYSEITDETRATLCRCGASKNKPFCDNSHKQRAFHTGEMDIKEQNDALEQGGKLTIRVHENGPYEVVGNFQIESPPGRVVHTGTKIGLCRCGGSGNKPFCDGTHNEIGFEAE